MDNSESSGIVTTIISHEIALGAESRYEAWLTEIRVACMAFPGYLSTDVIRPVSGLTNYTVIIRFASFAELSGWMESTQRREMLAKMSPFLPKGDRYETRTGLEFWFTPKDAPVKHPTRWKQWLLTWSAIFPLTVVIPYLLRPLFTVVPLLGTLLLSRAIVAAAVVAMMVYVVMPRYTKLVSKWLFD
ncbi:antibiotic biosynthesis monooxygenase [Robbsia sp. KACC 23696]|uniref:antibiotic biosynthesis monooxygenase n=1 Tax=Robbsia sp. KACC 23696 TaxID=3149231 RepID=UPI00325BF0A3